MQGEKNSTRLARSYHLGNVNHETLRKFVKRFEDEQE